MKEENPYRTQEAVHGIIQTSILHQQITVSDAIAILEVEKTTLILSIREKDKLREDLRK